MGSSRNIFTSLFKREHSLESVGFFNDFIDYHSHLLPGVDDGMRESAATLALLDEYERLGAKSVIFTPHVMEDYSINGSGFLRSEFERFKSSYKGQLQISLAAEYMLDSKFEEHLSSGDMLTLFDNYLLVETSYMSAPLYFHETLKDIMSKGYNVVLAHPERYLYMSRADFSKLKQMGVLFQLNLLSLTHFYGREVKSNAEHLLNLGFYSLLGSDTHHENMFKDRLKMLKLSSKNIEKLNHIRSIF